MTVDLRANPDLHHALHACLRAQDQRSVAPLGDLTPSALDRLQAAGLIVRNRRPGVPPEVTDAGERALLGHRPGSRVTVEGPAGIGLRIGAAIQRRRTRSRT